MPSEVDPFRGFHRYTWWMTLATRSAVLTGSAVIVTALCLVVAAAPAPAPSTSAQEPAPQVPGAPVNVVLDTLPAPALDAPAEPAVPELAEAGTPVPAGWRIDIDTTGHQAEIDACLWVRMDLQAVAPLVGAHNYCGGEIVLGMTVGETVTLTGTSLDGVYTVVESRDAFAGDSAAAATEGLVADVILQTCYWHSNGRERLLALQRV